MSFPNERTEPDALFISNGQLSARILPFGASLADLRLVGQDRPLVLGYPDPQAYSCHDLYFGAVIGRYANRIADSTLVIGDKRFSLEANDGGHHLHGGSAGFGCRSSRVDDISANRVVLSIDSPDGAAGYPGNLCAHATYRLRGTVLSLQLEARTDRPTPVNLCHHPYFNLMGEGDVGEHQLEIHATHYLPTDSDLIPTGTIEPVAGSSFDFTTGRVLKDVWKSRSSFNNTYCRPGPAINWHAATLTCDGIKMEVHTDQPGVHFYDGYKIGGAAPGHSGQPYGPRDGLCLEAHGWPDSLGRPHFPDAILRPGHIYSKHIEYRIFTS